MNLFCLLFGHKTVHKAMTGNYVIGSNLVGMEFKIPLYRWERTTFVLAVGRWFIK